MKPKEYFEYIKDKKRQIKDEDLLRIYKQSIELLNKYKITGQSDGIEKLMFLLRNVEKEFELLDLGYRHYVEKDDIAVFIEEVSDKVVKVIEIGRYEREIPDEIVENIVETKSIFDDYFVVFTDYTGEAESKVEKERREEDPILFGVFYDVENQVLHNRFYYLGDWEDEYCDLTLDKMVREMAKKNKHNIKKDIDSSEDIEELKRLVNYKEKRESPFRKILKKIRSFWGR